MFRIGEFSKVCRIPVSALRYYADIGLPEPTHIDPFTNYRYYSISQLPRLNRILALRDLGFSLDQIKQALDDNLTPDEMRGMLRLKQAEIEQHVEDEQARLNRVAARLKQIEQEGTIMPEQDVILKTIEPQCVIAIREVVPLPENVGTLLGESFMALGPRGIAPVNAPLAIFYDEEFKPADLDVEVAIPVAPQVKETVPLDAGRQLAVKTLPGMDNAACIIHTGFYDNLTTTYTTLACWIEANGYRIAGPSREVYLTAPNDPAGHLTEIQYPVVKA